ncbi:MAG: hypothetical protein KC609_04500 [Myxococcales bacterium]|nr:hypothetical protein [Myxococcales bacterium]
MTSYTNTRRTPWLWIWTVALAAIVVTGYLVATRVPKLRLERLQKAFRRCVKKNAAAPSGGLRRCLEIVDSEPLARFWRMRKRFAALRAQAQYDITLSELRQTTWRTLDAKERDRLAETLLRVTFEQMPRSTWHRAIQTVLNAGAFGVLSRVLDEVKAGENLTAALRASLMLGDWTQLRRLLDARFDPAALWTSRRVAALHCLLGDKTRGLALATTANRQWQNQNGPHEVDNKLALIALACGMSRKGLGRQRLEPPHSRIASRYLRPADAPDEIPYRLYLFELHGVTGGARRLTVVAQLLADRLPALEELLIAAVPTLAYQRVKLPLDLLLTPWGTPVRDFGGPSLIDAKRFALAAERLIAYLERTPVIPPLQNKSYGSKFVDKKAAKDPRGVLRSLAIALALTGAAEHARLGHADESRHLLERLQLLRPTNELWLVANVYARIGDTDKALALYRRQLAGANIASLSPLHRGFARVSYALALARKRRFEEALKQAQTAQMVDGVAVENRELKLRLQSNAAWLSAALALRLGRSTASIAGVSDGINVVSQALDDLFSNAAFWWQLATSTAEKRRQRRRLISNVTNFPREVLPAVIDLVSRAAGRDGDVEVWLDRVFAYTSRAGVRDLVLARSVAALWRNDTRAAALWRARAERLNSLVTNYRTAVLAHIAEL